MDASATGSLAGLEGAEETSVEGPEVGGTGTMLTTDNGPEDLVSEVPIKGGYWEKSEESVGVLVVESATGAAAKMRLVGGVMVFRTAGTGGDAGAVFAFAVGSKADESRRGIFPWLCC